MNNQENVSHYMKIFEFLCKKLQKSHVLYCILHITFRSSPYLEQKSKDKTTIPLSLQINSARRT